MWYSYSYNIFNQGISSGSTPTIIYWETDTQNWENDTSNWESN